MSWVRSPPPEHHSVCGVALGGAVVASTVGR
ncbi:MAG: hypothetical protein H0W25_18840 [Acidimicrobiia bacterium]|nr:hypothetical protein [Acidimicrobiia bacterium]